MKPADRIRLLMLDIDGVITDGTVVCSSDGPEHKRYSFRDVDAVFEARRNGLVVALVTGEDTDWADSLATRLEADHLVKGAKEKLAAVTSLAETLDIDLSEACYIGDSARDAAAVAAVGLGLAPADASPVAKIAADRVLTSRAGHGAVDEAVRLILAPERSMGTAADSGEPEVMLAEIADDSVGVLHRTVERCGPSIAASARSMVETLDAGGKILAFGNGGSASDAEHLAAELIGRFEIERPGLAAIALTANSSVMTALGNDFGLDSVFDRQIRALAHPGDTAIAISTSGRSPNVLAGLDAARALGLRAIGLTGGTGGEFPCRVDHCLTVLSDSTARIQEAHRLIIHMLCALVDDRFGRRTVSPR